MIPDERMPEDLRKEATLVVRGTAHSFRPELFGLPPFAYSPVKVANQCWARNYYLLWVA